MEVLQACLKCGSNCELLEEEWLSNDRNMISGKRRWKSLLRYSCKQKGCRHSWDESVCAKHGKVEIIFVDRERICKRCVHV